METFVTHRYDDPNIGPIGAVYIQNPVGSRARIVIIPLVLEVTAGNTSGQETAYVNPPRLKVYGTIKNDRMGVSYGKELVNEELDLINNELWQLAVEDVDMRFDEVQIALDYQLESTVVSPYPELLIWVTYY